MKRNLALLAICASVFLSLPYLFFVSTSAWLGTYLWMMVCLVIFVVLTYRWRNRQPRLLILVVLATSLGIALPSVMVVSPVQFGLMVVSGGVVYGLFAWGAAHLGGSGLAMARDR